MKKIKERIDKAETFLNIWRQDYSIIETYDIVAGYINLIMIQYCKLKNR